MKPTIVSEGLTDETILRALLPPELLKACQLKPIAPRSTLISIVCTHLVKKQTRSGQGYEGTSDFS